MTTVNTSIRLDENLKREAEKVIEAVGLNMSVAITAFLKQVVRQQKIPFELSASDPYFDVPENIAAIEKGIKQYQNGEVVTLTLDDIEKMSQE